MNQVTSFSFDQLSGPVTEQQTDGFAERAQLARKHAETRRQRNFDIEWLANDGAPQAETRVAPSLPFIETAFNAFARGSLVDTPNGSIAIEDLQPGDMICTENDGAMPLLWKGGMTISRQSYAADGPLFRVTNGSFGNLDAMPDPLFGLGARLLRTQCETGGVLHEISSLCDGFSVVRVFPRSAVQVFHLALGHHSIIRVNGLAMESFHPGHKNKLQTSRELMKTFTALFPHLNSLADFGPQFHKRAESID